MYGTNFGYHPNWMDLRHFKSICDGLSESSLKNTLKLITYGSQAYCHGGISKYKKVIERSKLKAEFNAIFEPPKPY